MAVVALLTLIAWELHPKNRAPVVNFHVLKNRELSAALFLFIALGFGLYGGIFLFPLFSQTILRFTPTQTGLVLLPGGIATGVSAILCGRLLNGQRRLVHPRVLIVIGMSLFIYSMWSLGHLTTQSGEADTRWALIIRGFGLGLLFIPINIAAFSTLRGAEIAQGAAMMNLMRQLGGSFGIAVLGTYLTRQADAHRVALAAHIYPGNPVFQQRWQMISGALMHRGFDPVHAKQAALAAINGIVQTQAMTMSYNDAFQLIGWTVVLVAPAVLLLRGGNVGRAAPVDAH